MKTFQLLLTSALFIVFTSSLQSQITFDQLNTPKGVTASNFYMVGEAMYLQSYQNIYYKSSPTTDWQTLPIAINSIGLPAKVFKGEDDMIYQLLDKQLLVLNVSNWSWELLFEFTTNVYHLHVLKDGSLLALSDERYVQYANQTDFVFETLVDLYEIQMQYNQAENVDYEFKQFIVRDNTFAAIAGDRKENLYFLELYESGNKVDQISPNYHVFQDGFFDNEGDLVWDVYGIERYNFTEAEYERIEVNGTTVNSGLYQLRYKNGHYLIYYAKSYYHSTDRGETWEKLNPYGNKPVYYQQGILDLDDDGFILNGPGTGTVEIFHYDYSASLIDSYKTEFDEWLCSNIHLAPGKLLSGSNNAYYYESNDDGQSWTQLGLNSLDRLDVYHQSGYYYTADYSGFYRSVDGQAWEEVSNFLTQEFIQGKNGEYALINNNGMEIYNSQTEELKSFDNNEIGKFHINGDFYFIDNQSLNKIDFDLGQTEVVNDLSFANPILGYYMYQSYSGAIIIIADDPTGFNCWYSYDQGESFEKGATLDYTSLSNEVHVNESGIYILSEDKLSYSIDDLKSISSLDVDISEYQYITDFTMDKSNYIYLGAALDGIFKSSTPVDIGDEITGSIFRDLDGDCTEAGELYLHQQELVFTNDQNQDFNVLVGNSPFEVSLPIANYTIEHSYDSQLWEACNTAYSYDMSNPEHLEIGLKPLVNCAVISSHFSNLRMRRCFENNAQFNICNLGTQATPSGSVAEIKLETHLEYIEASSPLINQQDSTYFFDVSGINPFDCKRISINYLLSCDAELGDTHCVEATVRLPESCEGPNSASVVENCIENIGSYDPNDMHAIVENEWTQEKDIVKETAMIDYLIRFQNTGTDTAFTVKITTQLSEYLDFESVDVIDYSHGFIYDVSTEGMMEIVFNNILLPDSTTNLQGSNGFIKFEIPVSALLEEGDQIKSFADIYFDFNEPVKTNQVVLTAETLSGVNKTETLEFTLSPNPLKESINLQFESYTTGRVKVYDTLGKEVLEVRVDGDDLTIPFDTYQSGIYMLLIESSNQKYSETFFKE